MADETATPGDDPPSPVESVAPIRAVHTVKLPPRRQRFVEEYCVDLNATQAAIRAGYAVSSARQEGSFLLTNHDVLDAVREELMIRTAQTRITTGKVIREVAVIAFSNRADYVVGEDGGIYLSNDAVDPAAIRAVKSQRFRTRVTSRDVNGENIRESVEYDSEIQLHDKMKALITLLQYLGALKLPTPSKEIEPVSELLNRLPPEIAAEFRALLAGAVEGRGLANSNLEQPEQPSGNGSGSVPE